MSASPESTEGPAPAVRPATAVVSSGWLGPETVLGHGDDRKIGRAMVTSMAIHGGLFALLITAFTVVPSQVLTQNDPLEYKVVFLPEVGPGGGGGGSPAPAPPRPVEIPKHKAPVTVPVEVPTPTAPPPIPTLVAPIETTAASVIQSSGNSSVSLAQYGGGGRGGGVGSGTGNGVGPGTGGGFGGGAYQPGNGVTWPTVLREERPKYTSDAMRAKIQGQVELEIVVLENGTVGDVRVTKSLDRNYGLDEAAKEAARKWLFKPGVREGLPVATRVGLVLEFRLH